MTEARYTAVVIGASAGGTNALQQILPCLPEDFPLPVIITQHLHPLQDGVAMIHFGGGCALTVKDADEKEAIRPGFVYFAPPNYHLLIEADHTFSLSIDPKVNYSRPSIDILFECAARVYGSHLIAIILSGANNDGARGLQLIKEKGGLVIVQDPHSAEFSFMPEAALKAVHPDFVLIPAEIGSRLVLSARQRV